MKNRIHIYLLMFLLLGFFVACQEDELDSNSIFTEDSKVQNEFDHWLEKNYLYPYNVDFKYRMEDVESNMSYNLVPIDYNMAIKMAKIVKHVWFEAYDEAVGIDFMRIYAPKIIHLIGSGEWSPSEGTLTMGYAEGGLKVTLTCGNWLDPTNIEQMNYLYFKTMHHEFSHILHQNINYPTEYGLLSQGHYSPSGWVNRHELSDYAPFGFVTNYASSQPGEDIAEITCCYLTYTEKQWNTVKEGAGDAGWKIILQKIEIVNSYMKKNYGIDMIQLRKIIDRRCNEIQSLNLNDVSK